MATIIKEVATSAEPAVVWDAVRDIGALHTRLVPGFVAATTLEPGMRVVTFGNGVVVREPIVGVDEVRRRLVWTAEGGLTHHYNAAVQVFPASGGGCLVVWTADFLPDLAGPTIDAMMSAGAAAMKACLDRLTPTTANP
ncbi:SRPBCC family protein [Phreatobacter aquaticus]|uniref:SRPBCC family protein n=1 Tax=Phreatobacter aquaticus TaxID=2570229 RepID=A0A4D7QH91_9HYPH|nr:SRPBCC family protein [Phreatobacter aquaticus]QCK85209.1 SRPBCC family protein [Phreatobacter aquaticus]